MIIGISSGAARVLTYLEASDAAGEYRLFDRESGQSVDLFGDRDDLEGVPLQPMLPIEVRARDGLLLPCYMTLPEEEARSVPMVVVVHGGPYDRDAWGFSAMHQWLASRGYAVLSINFRGSTGFGKAFTNAADREWGGRMQDDLDDGVAWAVAQGIADPSRVALFGASYGGYAALMASARSPEIYACFVDICGPSNLLTFIESIPPYWHSWFATIMTRLADPMTEDGRDWLARRSPLFLVDRMTHPMLIVQGLQDARVNHSESRSISTALQRRQVPVTLITFPDEGHFLLRQQNRIALMAVVEGFLARHLGASFEPLGADLEGSSLQIEIGGEWLRPPHDGGSAAP